MVLMYVWLLLVGGLLFGTAAFAGSRAYELAGVAFALWLTATLVMAGGRFARRALSRDANRP